MNRYELHRIVEQIHTQQEYAFDVIDVIEDIEAIVSYFGLHPEIDAQERMALLHDLYPIASEAEIAEIAQLAI